LKVQAITTEPKTLEREIQQQTELLTLAAISLVINVLAISLAIASVATFGAAPLSLSLILILVFALDGCELIKNIHVRNRNNKFKAENTINHSFEAKKLVNTAHNELKTDAEKGESYQKMIAAMPEKPPSEEDKVPKNKAKEDNAPKSPEPLLATGQILSLPPTKQDKDNQKADEIEQNMQDALELEQLPSTQDTPAIWALS